MIDISLPLRNGMVTWPSSAGFSLSRTRRLDAGDPANVSHLSCDVHVGTHIDAPLHFVPGGSSVDRVPLDTLIGPAVVAAAESEDAISAEVLSALALAPGTKRVLLKTRNSREWQRGATAFRDDYVALTADAARWIVEREIALLGVDYLSVQRYHDPPDVHRILLEAGVVILEGLALGDVNPGGYQLICLPLRLVGAEGAPARAVLLSEQLA